MVFFCCEGCNETLKKNHVEGHTYKCSSCWAVSCVDCSKIFKGDEYKQHITCISEAEKYQKSLYRGPKGNKKSNPQEEWMDLIMEAAGEVGKGPYSQLVKTSLPKMAEMGNVPRNKKKFTNFLKNSLRLYRDQDAEELWQFLESRRAQQANGGEAGANGDGESETQNGCEDKDEEPTAKARKDKKRKKEEEEEPTDPSSNSHKKKNKKRQSDMEEEEEDPSGVDTTVAGDQSGCFQWDKEIVKALKKADNRQMTLGALKKEVVKLALETQGSEDAMDKKSMKKIFKQQVQSHPRVEVDESSGLVTYRKKKKDKEAQ